MNHDDHVRLIRGGIDTPGGVWADFGSGTGAFTLALAELIGSKGEIYSVDRDLQALKQQARDLYARYTTQVHYVNEDFGTRLEIPPLDGIVMANALHFYEQKDPIIRSIKSYLKPGGKLILVEYNVNKGNVWVPYPLSYAKWERLARKHGFSQTKLLATQPSRFLREMYSALSW
jgi:ubiquinone/menaquinone biosynthesis C-methylase UbiE